MGFAPAYSASRVYGFAFVLLVAALGQAVAQTCTAGANNAECAQKSSSAAAHKDHLLLQMKPMVRASVADEASELDDYKFVDQNPPRTFNDAPVSLQQQEMDRDHSSHVPKECQAAFISRRRREETRCTCRRRHSSSSQWTPPEDVGTGWQCQGNRMIAMDGATQPGGEPKRTQHAGSCEACLCVFDIDRTLTGKQGDTRHCPRNRGLRFYDSAYGGGKATLSELASKGIQKTFCNKCYLGITSAGDGSGDNSDWNRFILDNIMRSEAQDALHAANPSYKRWSHGTSVHSPYVLGQPNRLKQEAVELIRQWYGDSPRGVCIKPENVFFFGDRTENIEPFQQRGFNSREISCASRDRSLHHGGVGYCGATLQEIRMDPGNILCR